MKSSKKKKKGKAALIVRAVVNDAEKTRWKYYHVSKKNNSRFKELKPLFWLGCWYVKDEDFLLTCLKLDEVIFAWDGRSGSLRFVVVVFLEFWLKFHNYEKSDILRKKVRILTLLKRFWPWPSSIKVTSLLLAMLFISIK